MVCSVLSKCLCISNVATLKVLNVGVTQGALNMFVSV